MSKNRQVLSIEPADRLVFKGPYKAQVTSYLKLTNPTDRVVCFKVKTTAPKQYNVRPSQGIINAGETTVVAVMLHPFDESAGIDYEQIRHRFLVQSVFAPSDEFCLDTLWKKVVPTELMDSKLNVVFDTSAMENIARDNAYNNSSNEIKISLGENNGSDRKSADRSNSDIAKMNLERENNNLKARIAALEAISSVGGNERQESGIAILQVALIALAALLIGLIFGKLF